MFKLKTLDAFFKIQGILCYKKGRAKMDYPNWALTMSQFDIFFPGRLKIELN